MNAITILSEDLITYKNFEEGSPVQIRVHVSDKDETYEKGTLVNVIYKNKESNAKVVSDPIVITENKDQENIKELSLVIEKI